MEEPTKVMRLSKAGRELNVGLQTIVDFLHKKGFPIENNPNSKIPPEMWSLLTKEFQTDLKVKEEAKKIGLDYTHRESISIEDKVTVKREPEFEDEGEEQVIKSSLLDYDREHKAPAKQKPETKHEPVPEPKHEPEPIPEEKPKEPEVILPPVEEVLQVVEPEVIPEPVTEEPVAEKKPEPQEAEVIVHEEETSPVAVQPEPVAEVEIPDTEIPEAPEAPEAEPTITAGGLKVFGKINLDELNQKTKPGKKTKEERKEEQEAQKKGDKKRRLPEPEPEKEEIIVAPEEPPYTEPVDEEEDFDEDDDSVDFEEEDEAEESTANEGPVRADNFIQTQIPILEGPVILGKIELPAARKPAEKKPVASSSDDKLKGKKKKRKRIKKNVMPVAPETTENKEKSGGGYQQRQPAQSQGGGQGQGRKFKKEPVKAELSEEDIQRQIKETLARLSSTGKSKASKYRKLKRDQISDKLQEEQLRAEEDKTILKVTEFVTANELAVMMNVSVTQVISTCMQLGMMVSINQRLDAETLVLVAEEFGFKVEFVSVEVQEAISEQEAHDKPEDLVPRHPIVTVMGHVDHGKTLLLDQIRKTNVIAGEAGGITQHIGAYLVTLENGKKITFLDTPGHEAFTAMRARGAKITDVAIIIIAADDAVMPQTIEAINHSQAAGVPMVFAINKIDKPNANTDRIREQLANLNILVEEWGGRYQCQEVSAKAGINLDLLLEKVLLEAELLDLKANPNRSAAGTVIESSLDKGRGYVAKILVQNGTLKIGDTMVAGSVYGKVKAMYNERNMPMKSAGPSTPLLLLGLTGAPQAGDIFNVMTDEREAKAIASKRQQLQREQGLRTQKHITLDEIGRRIAIGDFKELNVIVKGDVDGSVEALSDSLLKQSTEQVQVNVIHKSVGPVTESDVLLASASNAIVVAFQVRPSPKARKLAEQEQIDIRIYSIIYNAINEIKSAIEGMLSPEIEEKIICNIEIRDVFKITKVGTIAGCMVLDGKLTRNTNIRLIRDGIVVYTGKLASLKRFKDDVKEVSAGMECGLNIESFNDIKVGDIIEGYEETEVKRKL